MTNLEHITAITPRFLPLWAKLRDDVRTDRKPYVLPEAIVEIDRELARYRRTTGDAVCTVCTERFTTMADSVGHPCFNPPSEPVDLEPSGVWEWPEALAPKYAWIRDYLRRDPRALPVEMILDLDRTMATLRRTEEWEPQGRPVCMGSCRVECRCWPDEFVED